MAKKSKKPAKKAAKKSSKAAGKPAKKATKKASKKPAMMDPMAPIPVATGRGAPPVEIGTRLVKMFNEGRFTEIEDAFWDKKGIASIEGVGARPGSSRVMPIAPKANTNSARLEMKRTDEGMGPA